MDIALHTTTGIEYLIAECQLTSPVQIDVHASSEDDLLRTPRPQTSFLNVLIQEASVLLYGDDMRADLPPVPFSQYVLDVIENGVFFLGRKARGFGFVKRIFPMTGEYSLR